MAKDWHPRWDDAIGQWTVSFTVQGERIRRRLGIREKGSKTLARERAKQLYDQAWARALMAPGKPKGTPFWKAAAAYVQSGGEARFLPPIIQYFGRSMSCEEIDQVAIAEAGAELYPGRARSTIRRQVDVPINAVTAFAAGKRRQPTGDQVRTRWLDPQEAERLLEAADERTRRMIGFLLGTGVRTGEMFAGEARDLVDGQFQVRAELPGAGKSSAAARQIRLPARACDLVGPAPEVGALFTTPKGNPYKMRMRGGGQMAATFNKARDNAGLGRDVTPHVLRHTWATWHYAQNRDLLLLMTEGGWAKAQMALRYTKLAPPDLGARLLSFGWDFRQEFGKPAPVRVQTPVFYGLS